MAINVIERAVTPYNNPGNRISNKERYSLYAPAAGINKPGMAGYDPEYFAVREQIVQLSSAFLASILRHVVMDDSIDPDGIKDTNTVYSNFVHEVIDRRDVEGMVSNLTVTGSLFVFRSDDVITEALFADGRIWTRRLKVVSGGIENVTQFEPEYDKHVTYDELAVNAVGTRTLQDGSIVTAKIVAKAVTTDKLDDKAVTADKLDDKAVTADKLDDKAVTVNKLSEELQQKFAQYDADVDAKAFISVSYNPVDGKLTFTSINGTTEIIDLPLELIVSGGYYKDTDDVDSLVLVLANGEEIEIPFDDVFADIIKEVAGDGVELIEIQSLSELPENPKECTVAILPLGIDVPGDDLPANKPTDDDLPVFRINVEKVSGNFSSDKTFAEIMQAHTEGKIISLSYGGGVTSVSGSYSISVDEVSFIMNSVNALFAITIASDNTITFEPTVSVGEPWE